MSLPVSHRFPFRSLARTDSAGSGGAVVETAAARRSRELRLKRERLIDEELAQSFPASDPPSWVQGVAPQPAASGCHEGFTKDQ
ncbi:hypothetical protein [Rhodanobacter sp. T12-5]|uniref:hypothetical protein n=1 Tax=Rhodanobacter sp. T12-5 TaxID=2024611 RepID=UPI0011EC5775|nr:hypothetical protein [Rhodanobacter sp. T12-5]KAA0069105.1 hypothetical protein CIW53_13375 [Rhodanobacter sp. T12-5]